MRPRWPLAVALVLPVALLWQAVHTTPVEQLITVTGTTMGTTYSVTVRARGNPTPAALKDVIDTRLSAINRVMSTWDAQSELSALNAAPAGVPVRISPELQVVLTAALHWSAKTEGALDITVGPLVNLWGYGPTTPDHAPTPAEIAEAMRHIGYRRLLLGQGTVTKELPGMYIDLSAIAKGYGVDEIGRLLHGEGYENFIVEIGGEVVAAGSRDTATPWHVGVERPDRGVERGEALIAALPLRKGALATSGSYHRFKEQDGRPTTHIIDPHTGLPAPPGLVSVTVWAPDCMTADALSTALFVMGADKGLRWVQANPNVEALFVTEKAPGQYVERSSAHFGQD